MRSKEEEVEVEVEVFFVEGEDSQLFVLSLSPRREQFRGFLEL